ncbi:GIY-YIG nuclease family protein [Paenibacillus sp. MWE-103]|uniref:GIY-YIG nuclease family protein n=1 Tax=Paenibacillus artemisiicola TaxID=1172618 RepID=A0ABS3W316_9BACL|nr:GIY-YIG nuclease family protein [Paenibacillus artemisiicola]MBO7742701.1 GIY-YIG nuclease family protein [Paenibacillus artemisiicola]
MDKQKRKELQEAYKEIKTYMGAIRIANAANGKVYVDAYPNLKNKWLTIRAQLDMGRFANAELQRDWKTYGESAFAYDVLEEKDAGEVADVRWETKQMAKRWLEKLEPYGDKGYNKPPKQP